MLVTARLGAEAALKAVCVRFGAAVFEQLPCLWQHMATALEAEAGPDGAPGGDPQALIHAIQVCGCGYVEEACVYILLEWWAGCGTVFGLQAKDILVLLDGRTPPQ